ncbi:hypothetical protein GQ600_22765 [Phytophthora cactorum]|nr:hypothetical protein GQ600_22765 [Phytophthora cactorum]
MAPTTCSKRQPPKGSKKAPAPAKGKTLKTPQGLLKHLSKKNKCDRKSVKARAKARTQARRLAI